MVMHCRLLVSVALIWWKILGRHSIGQWVGLERVWTLWRRQFKYFFPLVIERWFRTVSFHKRMISFTHIARKWQPSTVSFLNAMLTGMCVIYLSRTNLRSWTEVPYTTQMLMAEASHCPPPTSVSPHHLYLVTATPMWSDWLDVCRGI